MIDFNLINDQKLQILKYCDDKHRPAAGVYLAGSIAYGLDIENSDIDIRGFSYPSVNDILDLKDFESFEINKLGDITIYSLTKYVKLLLACNPNVIESLGIKSEHVLHDSNTYQYFRSHKSLFVSKLCANTFGGYATQQLRRIENAMTREDASKTAQNAVRSLTSSLEHMCNQYRSLDKSKFEVFEENNTVKVSGTIKDANFTDLKAFANACEETVRNAGNLAARNRKRSSDKLAKHASHLIRLLRMGSEMLETGEINTFRSEDRSILLDIKQGLWLSEDSSGNRHYDDAFWDLLNEEEQRFKYAKSNTDLPDKPNYEIVKEFVRSEHSRILYT